MLSLNFQQNYLNTLEEALQTFQGHAVQIVDQEKRAQQEHLARETARRQERAKPRWDPLLSKVFASLPSGVSLQSLSWAKGKTLVLNGGAASYAQVAAFISNLDHTGQFGAISLQQTRKKEAGIAFSLVAAPLSPKGGRL